jgi:hypothetical protein
MPAVLRGARRGARTLAALAVAAGVSLAVAAPANAAIKLPLLKGLLDKNTALSVLGCDADHDVSRPFSAWNDFNDYALAPGGDFESRASGWTLRGAAAVAAGNQPFDIGTGGSASLRVANGATVTSPAMCIDVRYPHFRVFARNNGSAKGTLKAEVLFFNLQGLVRSTASGTVSSRTGEWFPSDSLKIGVDFDDSLSNGAAYVAFRFTAGTGADWQIDDFYVDPRMRR